MRIAFHYSSAAELLAPLTAIESFRWILDLILVIIELIFAK